ncbi:nucleotidyltransferase domain-containing protein [Rathayibacter sp. VKM Ac-2927]|uniref:phosphorylase family protein n=1 Tax=Rathayibacter sp. VKM Ac-2927 TaxID=2929478 RepID=UPI001FB4D7B1|nr:nucleotidyltransferase domain-containing protein [Rathayibacter sp. VKM Ac-2927]MCJ1686480.1 nucleotidyltransferase domain-containing protein [Rathayibacter sp. VKM Ac-2927]
MSHLRPDHVPQRVVDLQEVSLELAEILEDSSLSIWIFGSRRHRTLSPRSDLDILVHSTRAISEDQASRIWHFEPYLDVFETTHGVARSIVNGSQIAEDNLNSLVEKLDAKLVFDCGNWVDTANEFRTHTVLAERNPAASMMALYDLEDAVPAERADILVLAALPLEYRAAVKALGGTPDGSAWTLCHVPDMKGSDWRVLVRTPNTMGSVAMALETADGIRRTKAAHVVLVGICAGIPKRSNLLDVIIPTQVSYYEPGKITFQRTEQNPAHLDLDHQVAAKAANLVEVPGQRIRATDQVMGCGEKVIADKRARRKLEKMSRKLSAIDMESYGLALAATRMGRFPTVIKSVCDLGDKNKSDSHQASAAEIAAKVLHRMIFTGVFAAVK